MLRAILRLSKWPADGAILLDIGDRALWMEALRSAVEQPEQMRELRERALLRAGEFSWTKTARLTRAVYEQAIQRFRRVSPASGSKPRALFLAAEAPYPTIGGGPIRATSVLEYLSRRFSVHGIFFREPGAPDPGAAIPPGRLDRVDVIDLPFHSKHPLARVLRNASRLIRNRSPLIDRFSGFEAQIERFVSGQRYEAAFIEHFWCAPYVEQVRRRARRVILDVYNVESAWHRSMASSESGVLAWSHRRFAQAALELERYWLPRFDRILATSCNDAKVMRDNCRRTRR